MQFPDPQGKGKGSQILLNQKYWMTVMIKIVRLQILRPEECLEDFVFDKSEVEDNFVQ